MFPAASTMSSSSKKRTSANEEVDQEAENYDDENEEYDEEDDLDDDDYDEDEEGEELIENSREEESRSVNNEIIINTLSQFVSDENNADEDLPSYKAKMKVLLEQLMLKLEEDVDYQRNLEVQIDDLEKEVARKDFLLDQLRLQVKDATESNKVQMESFADDLMEKVKIERSRRHGLEKIILRLQNEVSKYERESRMAKLIEKYPQLVAKFGDSSGFVSGSPRPDTSRSTKSGGSNPATPLTQLRELSAEIESLQAQLKQSQEHASRIERQREVI